MDMFCHYLNEVAKWLAVPIFLAAAFLPDSVIGSVYFVYFIAAIAAINMASALMVYTPLSLIDPVSGTGRFIAFLVTGLLVPLSLYFDGLIPEDVQLHALVGWFFGVVLYQAILFVANE